MNDAELCQKMLDLPAPWKVVRVEVSHPNKRMDIWLEHGSSQSFNCPKCTAKSSIHDHAPERVWRHLDAFEFQTFLHARLPRIKCEKHDVKTVQAPWASPGGRFTIQMECKIIETLNEVKTIKGAGRLLGLSWDRIFTVIKQAVARGEERRGPLNLRYIGVDEKAFKKGQSYFTVVADLDKDHVVYMAPGRTKESLGSFYESLERSVLEGIQGIAMDMWQAYETATVEHVPDASGKIVYDRFHCMQMLMRSLDDVRRDESLSLAKEKDFRLKHSRYALCKNPENLTDKQQIKLDELVDCGLRTSKAWAMKEFMRSFWTQPNAKEGNAVLRCFSHAVESMKIRPMQKVAKAFMRRRNQMLNWFRHQITTGKVESLNGKIMEIKRRAKGHRNYENLTTAVMFFLGGLDIWPRPVLVTTH